MFRLNKIVIIVLSIAGTLCLVTGLFLMFGEPFNKKLSNNNEVLFDDSVILEHLTIKDIKLSKLNTIDDFVNELDAEIIFVLVCHDENGEEVCPSISYTDFTNGKYDIDNISSIIFYMNIKSDKNELEMEFSVSYKIYSNLKNNSQYFCLDFFDSKEMIKLDDTYLENVSLDEIKNKYRVNGSILPYIEFNSLSGDNYRFDFSASDPSIFSLFNYSQRDRGL